MAQQFQEVGKVRDYINDSQTHEPNSWADAASREWQTFGAGAIQGAWSNGLKHYQDNPLDAVRDVATGVGLQAALKGPAMVRIPAMAIAAVAGIDFAANTAKVVHDAIPRMQETAANPGSAAANRQWAEKNLGPVAFDTAVIGGTFGLARFGPKAFDFATKRQAIVETLPTGERYVAPATDGVMTEEAQRVQALLSKETDYRLLHKMERGTRGAWLVESPDGEQHIFKVVSPDDTTAQIRRSAESAQAANSLASPTPRYERVEHTPGFGSWYVQEVLPGTPSPHPSDRLIEQLMDMNDRQAGKATTTDNDWSKRVVDNVFNDASGWQHRIDEHGGAEGKQLVSDVREFVAPYRGFEPRRTDVVHGDFQHWNALVGKNDRLTGYVDWEGAGNGDRAIDLSRLLYDAYVSEPEIGYRANPNMLAQLSQKIEDVSGRAALDTYMSHWILQVADYGTKLGPTQTKMFVGVGNRILNDLKVMHEMADYQAAAS